MGMEYALDELQEEDALDEELEEDEDALTLKAESSEEDDEDEDFDYSLEEDEDLSPPQIDRADYSSTL
jgi:hypothetical protein